jgi:metal-responsive CopG/Arc/MetJ family transcriptional regulator
MARPKEFTKPKRLPIDLEETDIAALDEIAADQKIRRSTLVRQILQRYIKRHNPKG